MMTAINEPFLFRLFFCELTLVITAYVIFCWDMWSFANRVLLLFWSALCLLFPFQLAVLLFVLGIAGNSVLQKANLYKIAKTQLPITWLDIAITARNPATLFFLFGHSKRWLAPCVVGLFAIGTAIVSTIFMFLKSRTQIELVHLLIISLLLIVVFLYFRHRLFVDICKHFKNRFPFGSDVRNHMGWTLGSWEFDSISTLSTHLGTPAFILYTHILAKKEVPAFFKKTKVERPILADDLVNTAKLYIPSLPAMRPHIVIMQCESIFDPARAFILSNNYKNAIFIKNKYTKCLCPLRVNTIGAGSWISEFEALTGLDTRLFGYLGYYSHVSLAPYILDAFPAFLGTHGYVTQTFYPATGKFYNAEKAYLRYGFKDFLDSRTLNLPDEWASTDVDIANAFIQRTHEFEAKPYFSYLVTNGAHGPYSPDHYLNPISWKTSFLSDCDPMMNAELNEYIKFLGQTEEAVHLILERLTQIEHATSRPFVFVVYGDHQPFSFTDDEYNYNAVRSASPKNQTFVHVMSSIDTLTIDLKEEIPLTLLSSIVSASVVHQHKDIYALPNFYLYKKNGSDFFPGYNAPNKFGVKQKRSMNYFTHENAEAIAALQRLNIMKIHPSS